MKALEDLVQNFASSVAGQADAIQAGDPKKGNVLARRYIAAFEQIRGYGDPGREALAALLTHQNRDVRVMAAAYLIRYCEKLAKAVLKREAKGSGLTAFGAKQALQRWKEGTWTLDPE